MKYPCLVVMGLSLTGSAFAQSDAPVRYEVSFPNAVHHEAQISMSLSDLEQGPLTVQMSRASPGRYAIHEFAKNVYEVRATRPDGTKLDVDQSDPYSWVISGHAGQVDLEYTLYADRADGTYSQIDLTHAHLNAPASFMWAQGLEDRAIEIAFDPSDETWKAATQLFPTDDALAFTAPNLQYFMDSPVELSAFDLRTWQVGEGDNVQTIRLALHHDGTDEDLDLFTEKAKKVVAEQIRLFGEAPAFDTGTYTFIADYLPHASRDGMEHRNSTILSHPSSLLKADFSQLGTLSHEFIHAWNVERLRPADLEPFDFTVANPSHSLWFAEGFTSYYGPLTIRRAGEQSVEAYLGSLGRTLSRIVNAPGRTIRSPRDMSLRAPFVDAAATIDPTNHANTFVSYYPYGAMIALALDLSLRGEFKDVTLDDYMRLLWDRHGRSQTPYTNADLRRGLADVSGDQAFADRFFETYIERGELPDYGPLLARAGLSLELANPDTAWIGTPQYSANGDEVMIDSNTLKGTPLYSAGLDRGDEIVKIGRYEINSADDIANAIGRHQPGDELQVDYVQRGAVRSAALMLMPDPALHITLNEAGNGRLPRRQRKFREDWLGTVSD
ncbi:MAG: PDZ domain-containing protein [Hyphomonadaceae bacterium]